jgi:hypothetical protein
MCLLYYFTIVHRCGDLSTLWGHAGMSLDRDGMSETDNMDAMGGKSIFDGIPTEEDCRICHDDLDRFPMLEYTNVDLHHNLIGTVIPELDESTAPDFPDAGTGELNLYECLSCHVMHDLSRDCLRCHPVWIVTGPPGRGDNVHHDTFGHSNCGICHND